MILLGIDFGTSGCKVTLISEDGRILDEGYAEYETATPFPGWAEQNPEDWCSALRDVLKAIRERSIVDFSKVAALAIDASTHNTVLLDNNFKVLRPTIMWTDQRSVAESAELNDKYGDLIYRIAYQIAAPTWTLPQLLWLRRHEPTILEKTSHMMFVKDYVRWRLTDEWCTDTIDAQGTLFFDMEKQQWSEELCALAGIPLSVLPPLVAPTTIVGAVTAEGSYEFGLPQEIPVICGCSDSAVEDYGAGAIEPGHCILKLATAGNVNLMTERAEPDKHTLTYSHVIPGMWYSVAATNTAARAQRWFRDLIFGTEDISDGRKSGEIYEKLNREAAESPPGAKGLFFHPYLLGERAPYWDAQLRASFVGATMQHSRSDFMRAVLEGVVFSLRDCYRTMEKRGMTAHEFRLIGGGAKSPLWVKIVADVFGAEIIVPQGSDASFGSALLAGVGIGIFPDERAAAIRCVKSDEPVKPDPACMERYERFLQWYYHIHDVLADVYHEMGKL